MERWCPSSLAASWDRVGLQVGHPEEPVEGILVTLDVNIESVDMAKKLGANLIISHHPFIFEPLEDLRFDQPKQGLVAHLLREGLAVYSAHTNLDQAPGGTDDRLAGLIGLEDVEILQQTGAKELLKLVVYVPQTHGEAVGKALGDAGAGRLGNYSHCSFQVEGTGTFFPQAGSRPFIGEPGQVVRVPEVRIETVVPRGLVKQVVAALNEVHPYEEIAYDLFPLQLPGRAWGFGRLGTLPQTLTLEELAERVKASLAIDHVRVVGDLTHPVARIATGAGSGGSLVKTALAQGADVLITGDLKHHEALLAKEGEMALIDAGHQGTEAPMLEVVTAYLREHFMDQDPDFISCHRGQTVFKWF